MEKMRFKPTTVSTLETALWTAASFTSPPSFFMRELTRTSMPKPMLVRYSRSPQSNINFLRPSRISSFAIEQVVAVVLVDGAGEHHGHDVFVLADLFVPKVEHVR